MATFFWALDTLIRYPLMAAGFSAVHIVLIEHVLLVGLMSLWLTSRGLSLWAFARRDWGPLLVIGALGSAVGTLAFTQAFSLMNPTLVILLQKLQPLVAIALAGYLLNEPISPRFLLCVLLALFGSLLLIAEDVVVLLQASQWHYRSEIVARLMGYGLALLAVVSWGASTVFGKRLSQRGYRSDQIMQGRFLTGLVALLPFMLISSAETAPITLSAVALIGLMIVISGVVGMLLYYQGLQRIASRHSALAEMAFPVMAGVINWVFLGFALTIAQIIGAMVLIAASVIVHQFDRPSTAVPAT
ncbi:drug/metabolite transporter (DMT) superfamily protein [Reinekea blandensis MED297]|uniref:Drug/metabolite transporter (DMT) superfamily protein n=1 Tax=Reinekea blandensis MED297 TaxID=314283 RepID=A4BE68_9GAMM|nr:drug/metabolite transporter (DMT) superfamily protein [Reinekea blandensis MED297]